MVNAMTDKDELLKQLEKMGVDPSKKIRKPRADAGLSRTTYKPRSDRGKQRGSYINTPAKYKAVYERMLTAHATDDGRGGDTLTRDNNGIFPPYLNRQYKLTRGKDRDYINSVVKAAHIEQARWRWLMAEYAENPDQWRDHISNWYFIKPQEIDLWMYTEWAWAYVYYIRGDENRLITDPKILSYDDYLAGKYNGRPKFDSKGELVWDLK